MTWLLKGDFGQPSSKFIQAGAGLEAVRENIPVSDDSREI